MTLTSNAERLTVQLSIPIFYDLFMLRLGFGNPTFSLQSEDLGATLGATSAAVVNIEIITGMSGCTWIFITRT